MEGYKYFKKIEDESLSSDERNKAQQESNKALQNVINKAVREDAPESVVTDALTPKQVDEPSLNYVIQAGEERQKQIIQDEIDALTKMAVEIKETLDHPENLDAQLFSSMLAHQAQDMEEIQSLESLLKKSGFRDTKLQSDFELKNQDFDRKFEDDAAKFAFKRDSYIESLWKQWNQLNDRIENLQDILDSGPEQNVN